jgi:hypothetical protein
MSYSQLLTPRPEVLSDQGIDGIIDLANLFSRRRALEKDAERFLALTCVKYHALLALRSEMPVEKDYGRFAHPP